MPSGAIRACDPKVHRADSPPYCQGHLPRMLSRTLRRPHRPQSIQNRRSAVGKLTCTLIGRSEQDGVRFLRRPFGHHMQTCHELRKQALLEWGPPQTLLEV